MVLQTNKLVGVLNKLYSDKNRAYRMNDFEKVIKCIEFGHIVANQLDYADYVRTDWFKDLRTECLNEIPYCTMCSRPAESMHHNQYDGILFKERIGIDVVGVCHECHDHFHDNRKVINHFELKKLEM